MVICTMIEWKNVMMESSCWLDHSISQINEGLYTPLKNESNQREEEEEKVSWDASRVTCPVSRVIRSVS